MNKNENFIKKFNIKKKFIGLKYLPSQKKLYYNKKSNFYSQYSTLPTFKNKIFLLKKKTYNNFLKESEESFQTNFIDPTLKTISK